MRRHVASGLAFLLALVVLAPPVSLAHADHQYHHLCTLVALPWDANTRVPGPELPAVAADGGATIQVTYVGFETTPQAQAAFQRAADIWAGLISSSRPIRIKASLVGTLPPGTLASAGASCYHANFPGATVADTWFPNPLADRLEGADRTGCAPDGLSFELITNFNNSINWYFGTDANPGSGRYDFVSVALHEIEHGLGFFGFGNVSSGQGTVLASGNPGIYDRFAVTEAGASLLTAFTSPSAALATQLTYNYDAGNPRGPGVYFSGTHTNAANGGQSARLYTVTPWNSGSSYSHLDESTYPPGHADSLMTYALSSNEAIHHPGNVSLGMFKDMGWSTCPAALSSTATSVAGGASTGSVTVTIEPGCVWAASSRSPFLTITSATSGTGTATITYAIAANTTGSSRQGTLRISGATFTVTQSNNSNTVAASPASLRFAGTNTSGTLSPITPAQVVTVTTAGTGTITWTATPSQPWVQVSPSSGTGSGVFLVSIVNPGNVLGASTDVSATVTIASTNAGNTATVNVGLALRSPGSFTAPIGQVDSPAQNASGIQGAIGVTGWAIDDVGVTGVKIYRDCLAFDNPSSCQPVLGEDVVFIGDAAFLAGARTDVEGAFPTLPQANRAGWGYLMLTSMLPDVPGMQMNGGQGALTLYAIATDVEGNQKILGRSADAADTANFNAPTDITMDNATIAKPFGAIDTPGQGATVSGILHNFGWALTPDTNTVAGDGDILIPFNSSTVTVFIDGTPRSLVTYNQCRGNNGNPPAPGVFCNDDVANIFGNTTPQPPHTNRPSNPTRYRNLDATRGAIGSFSIDTTTLNNGLHTIAWSVTDSASRTEGIGSRFFNVLNGGGDQGAAGDAALRAAPAQVIGAASLVDTVPAGASGVWGRVGYQDWASWTPLVADDPLTAPVYRVNVEAMGRIELWLGAEVTVGYLVANDTLRPLPPGATLAGPSVAWTPPVGYRGEYRLAFLRGRDRVDVIVSVK